MTRSVWTEITSFVAGGFIAASFPTIAQEGLDADVGSVTVLVFFITTAVLTERITRNWVVALSVASLNVLFWGGILAASMGIAYALADGPSEWSLNVLIYVGAGTAVAFLAWRGRVAFDAKANDFPSL